MVNTTGGALASKVKGKLITQPVHSTAVTTGAGCRRPCKFDYPLDLTDIRMLAHSYPDMHGRVIKHAKNKRFSFD